MRGKRLVLGADVDLLERPAGAAALVAFLSPLDPLVWDRGLL